MKVNTIYTMASFYCCAVPGSVTSGSAASGLGRTASKKREDVIYIVRGGGHVHLDLM